MKLDKQDLPIIVLIVAILGLGAVALLMQDNNPSIECPCEVEMLSEPVK